MHALLLMMTGYVLRNLESGKLYSTSLPSQPYLKVIKMHFVAYHVAKFYTECIFEQNTAYPMCFIR